MNKRTNLKAVPAGKPEQLTWGQIDRLACALSNELFEAEEAARLIMLLMREIAEHPFDHSHVEAVANLVSLHVFAKTPHADEAFQELMHAEREKWRRA